MTIHQLGLMGNIKARDAIDEGKIEALAAGDCGLDEALHLDDEKMMGLRRQAVALCDAGQWERCIDIVMALSALDSVHPVDPLLLARCYEQLGRYDEASLFASHAKSMMDAMGIVVPELGEGGVQ